MKEIYLNGKYPGTKKQKCYDAEGRDPAVREDIGGSELLLRLGAHVGLDDVEADPQHGIREAHPHHWGDQDQFTWESKSSELLEEYLNKYEDAIQLYFVIAPMAINDDTRRTMPTMMAAIFSDMEEPEYLKIALQ